MINFKEELKKFHPCLDVDQTEEAIYSDNQGDVQDLIKEIKADLAKEEQ
ncbi:MAG: hypothetical protein PHD70_05840 [Anaerostipes sp.]|jgi:hypothetical protein|nr:hypothetical protein [Anaerostipes sp.]MDD3745979.1 hypothetical protein [Anaerostipes sp.]MDD4371302.1 hypothetical protein [Anaerostipes sp.]